MNTKAKWLCEVSLSVALVSLDGAEDEDLKCVAQDFACLQKYLCAEPRAARIAKGTVCDAELDVASALTLVPSLSALASALTPIWTGPEPLAAEAFAAMRVRGKASARRGSFMEGWAAFSRMREVRLRRHR